MTLIVWDIGAKKIWERTKTSNLIVDHFSSTFVNLLLDWMLYFHVRLQNKGKFIVSSEYYNHFGIYQPSRLSFLEPRQINLSNPEEYSGPCRTPKMEFCENSQWLKAVNFVCETIRLSCLTGFWIRICNLLLIVWETEDANKIDSVAM